MFLLCFRGASAPFPGHRPTTRARFLDFHLFHLSLLRYLPKRFPKFSPYPYPSRIPIASTFLCFLLLSISLSFWIPIPSALYLFLYPDLIPISSLPFSIPLSFLENHVFNLFLFLFSAWIPYSSTFSVPFFLLNPLLSLP
jgi:hypothetical protein